MYKDLTLKFTGTAPLIMHNGMLADPLNYFSKEMKKISGKRNKTDADYERLAELEFKGGLWLNEDGEPCIPGHAVEATIVNGAKKSRKGKDAIAGLVCYENVAIEYDGPKDPDELWKQPKFRLVAGVVVQRNRVMRTRPIIKNWSAVIPMQFNDEVLNESEVISFAEKAGEIVGLGDWRPRYGRFRVEKPSKAR